MIEALHAATGATAGAAVRSPVAAGLLGLPLHLAGDRVALAACAPDVEHIIRLPRPGGSKLFHGRRGWHRSGGLSTRTQLLLAGFLIGRLVAQAPAASAT